ncbi:hypothetical protein EVAR_31378_1 [Eumeta japonica]|uniref:Uncharacterized protein n=1 Tax=Eumeta variegata TaxID=151549 RepID=A0A4C1XCT0_EUMVA|nr:hypothetical protein EVAR_31378_1 [Eumeta japonica]
MDIYKQTHPHTHTGHIHTHKHTPTHKHKHTRICTNILTRANIDKRSPASGHFRYRAASCSEALTRPAQSLCDRLVKKWDLKKWL